MLIRPLWMASLGAGLIGLSLFDSTHGFGFSVLFGLGAACLIVAGTLRLRDKRVRFRGPAVLGVGFGIVGFLVGAGISALVVMSAFLDAPRYGDMGGVVGVEVGLIVAPICGILLGAVAAWVGVGIGRGFRAREHDKTLPDQPPRMRS